MFNNFPLKNWVGIQMVSQNTINLCPAEPRYTLPLQTVYMQISWLLKKPADLDLHSLSFSVWIYINNLDKVVLINF